MSYQLETGSGRESFLGESFLGESFLGQAGFQEVDRRFTDAGSVAAADARDTIAPASARNVSRMRGRYFLE